MPEIPGQAPAPLPTAEEVAVQNAETIARVKAQEGTPQPNPLEQKAAGDALDSLLKEAEAKEKAEGTPPVEPKPEVTPKPEDADAATKAAAEAAKTADAEKAARDEELKKADDIFKDAQGLPQGASVKSHEAFSSIKIKAAQEISKLNSELETLRKETATLRESGTRPTPEIEQLKKEHEELKQWRAKMDVDFDPKFKEFDKETNDVREFIYAQLRKSSAITDKTIAEIKKFGGPDKIVMGPIFEAIKDPVTQRLVESKLADIELAKYKKEQAISQTKENVAQYMQAREQELAKTATATHEDTKKELDAMWNALDWTKPQTPKQGATEAEKKALENHNTFVTGMRKEIDAAMADNSPKMKATLLTAVAQLFNLQGVHDQLKTAHAALEKEATELRVYKTKIKDATRGRQQESQAAAAAASVAKPKDLFNTHAADGLDAIAKQVMAERAAKGGRA